MRYLIDNNLAPCSWMKLRSLRKIIRLGARVDKVYCVQTSPKQVEGISKPELRTLSFSMISYSKEGSAKPDRNPVVIISTVASNGEEKQFVAEDSKNDRSVIEAVC